MTTTISGSTATFYINNPPTTTISGDFTLKSQYSQEVIYTSSGYSVESQNERYAEIVVPFPADFKDKHYNGYYTFCFGDLCERLVVPGGSFSFFLDAAGRTVLFDQGERKASEQGEVLRSVVLANATIVLAKRHVEHPMQRILDPPMAANRLSEPLHA